MKKSIWCAIIFGSLLLLSFSSNPPQGNSGAPFDGTCARSGCHSSSGTSDGNVTIEGIPSEVEAGVKYPFKVKFEATSGGPARAGFQMVAVGNDEKDAGVISDPGSSSTTSSFQGRTYFEHQPAQRFGNSDVVEFTASWTAPSSGSATFYVSGIFANGSGSSGDTYVTTNASYTVKSASAALSAIITDVQDALCADSDDGSASVDAAGGTENYNYQWDNGESTKTAVALSSGEHSVTVSDGNSQIVLTTTIESPAAIEVDVSIVSSLECKDGNGTISADVSNGTPPYTYIWTGGASTQEVSGLSPGQYNVTITDSNGCNALGNVSLFAVDQTAPDLTVVDMVSLVIGSDGAAVAISSSDDIVSSVSDNCTGDIDVDWSPKTFTCDQVGENMLTVTATDESGNSSTKQLTVTIKDETNPTLTCITEVLRVATCAPLTYTVPTAVDNCDNIRLELMSGIGNNGSFPLGETMETYIATDASGNTATCQITIVNEPAIDVQVDITEISCAGESDGQVRLSATGANPPFNISFATLVDKNKLAAGTYEYTATDFTGCTFSGSFDITEPEELSIETNGVVQPTNSSSGDGSIDITVSGGTPPYTYVWMTENELFSNEEDLIQIFQGTYSLLIEDSRGCTITSEDFVVEELTSINDPEINAHISTYPNPAAQYLSISIDDISYSDGEYSLYRTDGSLLMQNEMHGSTEKIDLLNVENGLYILKLRMDDDFIVRAIMVYR